MPAAVIIATAVVSSFLAGAWAGARSAEGTLADVTTRLERVELTASRTREAGDGYRVHRPSLVSADDPDPGVGVAAMVETVKSVLVEEMGLLSLEMLRERQGSFAELYTSGPGDETTYGTASYLGGGYFLTVKHAVAAAAGEPDSRIRLRIRDTYLRASVVDSGDADGEVDPGDWAILKVDGSPDIQPLRINLHYSYPFADPVARLGNDYSRGVIATTGHVGQRRGGLVTCLTDGHPGVSGGGVLNRAGDLVGIQVGRLEGDFRFSFILPLRAEMFRRLEGVRLAFAESPAPGSMRATDAGRATVDRPARSVATGGLTPQ